MSFDRLGRIAVRHRWRIVAAWLVLIALALPFAPRAPSALSAGGFILDDLESARARQLLEQELGAPPLALVIVYSSPTLTARTPGWTQAVSDATRDVRSAPHVVDVLPHQLAPRQVSQDGHTAYDLVFLDLRADASPAAIPGIRERLHPVDAVNVELGGGAAFYGGGQAVSESDL